MRICIFDNSLEKFIKSLDKSTLAKVLHTIDLLEKFNFKLGLPHSKKILTNLSELRIRRKREIRIFYTFHKSEIILLYGFVKKSQKIPKKEINTAIQKLKQFD